MPELSAAPSPEVSGCERLLDVLEAESAALFGSRDRIESACAALQSERAWIAEPALTSRLPSLAHRVADRVSASNIPIVSLLCGIAGSLPDPWLALDPLLDSHDPQVVEAALDTMSHLAAVRPALIDMRTVDALATRVDTGDGPFADRTVLEKVAVLLRGSAAGTLEALFTGAAALRVRRLAARLLDLDGSLPSPRLALRLLGPDAADWLEPYLAWTRATHLDFLALASGAPAQALDSLERAEEVCGTRLLRELIGEIGWAHLNLGLTVTRLVGISINGSFPLFMTPAEASLIESCPGARRVFDRFLAVAHGGLRPETASLRHGTISRFREFNLAHADLLARFLEVAPLTAERVRNTVNRMDRVVEDFQHLFATYTDECAALARVYGGLRESIERALASEPAGEQRPVSSELVRLVDMFEDPDSLSAVTTMHGLKRYLHQRGLKLGMRLAESGRSANRVVTLALAGADRVLQTSRAIEYADFEAEDGDGFALPPSIAIVAEEFGRQLAHAQQPLPKVKIFCYGNEVHYFIAYRNHPAFVRIDFSPPARGGMIDLAYFGVSKYELASHPNPSLTALERFFRRLDFDINIDETHVRARYDKERAFDLGDLRGRAAALFRLAPYLMEIDWVIGDLELGIAAREQVARAWAEFFAAWGVLPHGQFLTRDRRSILAGMESGPTGERELRWNGSGPYRDRFSVPAPDGFTDHLRREAATRKLQDVLTLQEDCPPAQLPFEERVLRPLRNACARGEIEIARDALALAPRECFERRHPGECLATVLRSGAGTIVMAARTAAVATVLARGLRFRTVGAINGYDVQSASLPLPGNTVGLHALRDESGIFRLAIWAPDESLFVRRERNGEWRENWSVDVEPLEILLRRANYPVHWAEPAVENPVAEAARLAALFGALNPRASPPPLPGERIIEGVAASPGRAVGRVRLGLENRHIGDVAGNVVVSPSMSPDDGVFLAESAAVVSTGGGALSHAGLLALQYGKPALLVNGTWERSGSSLSSLVYRVVGYDERRRTSGAFTVTERIHLREHDQRLLDGDLVVVDADEGLLRVLGQEPAALAFHDSLRQLAAAGRKLAAAASDEEVLVERGRRLRARHQLEKVIARLTDPILARHAASELLLVEPGASHAIAAEKGRLLGLLVTNPVVGAAARDAARVLVETLARRAASAEDHATRLIPDCRFSWEVLSLRLDVLELSEVLASTADLLAASGTGSERIVKTSHADLEERAIRRIETLAHDVLLRAENAASSGEVSRLRPLLEELDRIDGVLGTAAPRQAAVERLRAVVMAHDRHELSGIASQRILDAGAGGIELRSFAGSKAANLAQVAQLGEGSLVPPWFVVTDCAFREAFESPLGNRSLHASTVRAAVEAALARGDLTNAQKASLIREAWEAATLPEPLVREVTQAYRALAAASNGRSETAGEPFVAVRSSAREEDLEAAARAGEFETFLFVRGDESLIAHLKRAWSGLWTERALHSRAFLGAAGDVGGGILVQRMVSSRASGVLHTVNVAERRPREMVINAGVGLGEGIVSGSVAADLIVVSKEGDLDRGELRLRYVTADKRQRVVFNSRVGSGTALVETLHHQRLRPSLEYVEIRELVRAAARLEAAYGYPLDIEFAVEGTSVFLLQVRPIPTPFAVWRDTAERWPLEEIR